MVNVRKSMIRREKLGEQVVGRRGGMKERKEKGWWAIREGRMKIWGSWGVSDWRRRGSFVTDKCVCAVCVQPFQPNPLVESGFCAWGRASGWVRLCDIKVFKLKRNKNLTKVTSTGLPPALPGFSQIQ